MGVSRKQSSLSLSLSVLLLSLISCIVITRSTSKSLISLRTPKITVRIQNLLPNNDPLKIHCQSSDDDLGEHVLGFRGSFLWRFRVNFLSTTKFQCIATWRGASPMKFDIYRAKRDSDFRCPTYCLWFDNATGVNGLRQHEANVVDLTFPWSR